jgi:hypothetical protein
VYREQQPQVDGLENAGTVCVYRFGEGEALTETPSQRLIAPVVHEHARFGREVVMTGDRIVVGASGEQKGVGAVYLFEPEGDAYSPTFRLSPTDGIKSFKRKRSR